MAKRTMTIKLDKQTKDFYRSIYLANKLRTWCEMYKALHNFVCDSDVAELSDEDILKHLGDKEVAKEHLSASEYENYLKYYDDVYVKE